MGTKLVEAQTKTVPKLEFRLLKQAVQRRFNEMKTGTLFRANIDKEEIWNLYLASFPEGTNPKFRERTEHDCSCCRSFIKNIGGLVAIVDNEITTLWDLQVEGFQPVVGALAEYVRSRPIENVFLHSERTIGTDKNFEELPTGVLTWEHFHVTLPSTLVASAKADIGPRLSEYRALHDVMLRSLQEITPDAIETVQDLIAQNSLYRGSEKKALVDAFAVLKRRFDELSESHTIKSQSLFAWQQVIGPNAFVCRMRSDVIGTLMVDLSEGVELEKAVKSFEDKVSGTNYKRPTALVTPKMRDQAKAKLQDLGLIDALERRYAHLEDVKITNVLYADRNAKTRMAGDVFDTLPVAGRNTKSYDKVEGVTIEKFVTDILPTASSLEVFVENRHASNFVSLIAPADMTAKSLFKWPNPFSWSYVGDVADSIKERVKSAGGNVTGDVCCRLAWFNHDDLDLHMKQPGATGRNEIFYGNRTDYASGGQLDVDMNAGGPRSRTPVENIFYPRLSTMPLGIYTLFVNQYSRRESIDVGFQVEIDILGTVHSFHRAEATPQGSSVEVTKLKVTTAEVEVIPTLPSSQASRQIWGLQTQEFHPVTAVMFSPNFWDGREVGNKHFFLMVDKCCNDGSARGFYNEFLSAELETHGKTMELVGARMRTDESEDQLSGLGFSSTQKNSLVVRVHGSFNRSIRIIF